MLFGIPKPRLYLPSGSPIVVKDVGEPECHICRKHQEIPIRFRPLRAGRRTATGHIFVRTTTEATWHIVSSTNSRAIINDNVGDIEAEIVCFQGEGSSFFFRRGSSERSSVKLRVFHNHAQTECLCYKEDLPFTTVHKNPTKTLQLNDSGTVLRVIQLSRFSFFFRNVCSVHRRGLRWRGF